MKLERRSYPPPGPPQRCCSWVAPVVADWVEYSEIPMDLFPTEIQTPIPKRRLLRNVARRNTYPQSLSTCAEHPRSILRANRVPISPDLFLLARLVK